MAKKDKQMDLRDYLLTEYVENNDYLLKNEDVKSSLNLLVDNGLATKIEDMGDNYSAYTGIELKYACKKMCDWNSNIKNYINKNLGNAEFTKAAFIPKEYIKISEYTLDDGIYYAKIKGGDNPSFAILVIKQDEKDYFMKNFTLYFVGKNCSELKNKFLKKLEKFKNELPSKNFNRIKYLDGRQSTQCLFKSFDQMVFTNKDKIISYIDNWKNNIPKYNKYGMIPKLSILLYGEPGTGKSTFCKALAKYLGINVVTSLSAEFFNSTNQEGRRYINEFNIDKTVYSIDDIDCIGKSRDDDTSLDNSQIISQLLEFLDNPPTFYYKAADDNFYLVSIVCATTNYYDRLDPAVKRYGRFDLKLEMNRFSEEEAQEMCDIYDLKLRDIYKDEIKEDTTFSPAHIQSLCTENIDHNFKNV